MNEWIDLNSFAMKKNAPLFVGSLRRSEEFLPLPVCPEMSFFWEGALLEKPKFRTEIKFLINFRGVLSAARFVASGPRLDSETQARNPFSSSGFPKNGDKNFRVKFCAGLNGRQNFADPLSNDWADDEIVRLRFET